MGESERRAQSSAYFPFGEEEVGVTNDQKVGLLRCKIIRPWSGYGWFRALSGLSGDDFQLVTRPF